MVLAADVTLPVAVWMLLVAPAIAAVGDAPWCGTALARGGVERVAGDVGDVGELGAEIADGIVAGTFDGAVELVLELVWHAPEEAEVSRASGEEEVPLQPAAFALPAVTHHSATAPSTTAAAQMATDGDPPREERMLVSHVAIPRDCFAAAGRALPRGRIVPVRVCARTKRATTSRWTSAVPPRPDGASIRPPASADSPFWLAIEKASIAPSIALVPLRQGARDKRTCLLHRVLVAQGWRFQAYLRILGARPVPDHDR